MKNIKLLLILGIATALALPLMAGDGPVTRRGTSVLHYMTRNEVVSTDNPSNVIGRLRLQYNEQGHALKQSLQLGVAGLETNSSYGLIAVVGNDANTVPVSTFATDRNGRGRIAYLSKAQGRGGRHPLPDVLSPLTDLRAIGIENRTTQTVAYAWIDTAEHFQYLVKRNLTPENTNGTAAGSISLIANPRHVSFRLLAGGLHATSDYHLALNSSVVVTATANNNGRLEIKGWPTNAPAVLDLRSLSLLDSSSNVVLKTSLPR